MGDRLRQCERDRNDLRTRLAGELRKYQTTKDELAANITKLHNDREFERIQHENKLTQLNSETREREFSFQREAEQKLNETETGLRRELEMLTERYRGDRSSLEGEINNLRTDKDRLESMLTVEKDRTANLYEQVKALEVDK